jgi:indolepyruvate ferredoxin oxidoreductase
MMQVFRWLSRLKGLRGTIFDPFGQTAEAENGTATAHRLRGRHRTDAGALLTEETLARAIELAECPSRFVAYGHVKAASVLQARTRQAALRVRLLNAAETATLAA